MLAIKADRVSKCFSMSKQRSFLAKALARKLLMLDSTKTEHWALRDVSFEIEKGESVAVIGENGSGKSTLLSLIAQVSYPTTGTVEVNGRVGPMLELGAGFHHDLTGLENIYLNAALLGLDKDEVDAKLQSIVDYAEIGDFLHSPIHTYSSGMYARLGFAVLAHIDPDILIVDEALAVGDTTFQSKCEATMNKMLGGGTTMFLVSHNTQVVQDLCQKAIWMHRGRMRRFGPCEEVVHEYHSTYHELKRQEAEAEQT